MQLLKHVVITAVCVVLLIWPIRAVALDQADLRLKVPPGVDSDEIADALRAASLLYGLVRDEVREPRDVLAAARGEYARMVETLYALGHYSGVVEIKLDGREAAQIDPFQPPQTVGRALIIVEAGRPFRLGQTSITPLAPQTELPETFRQGRTARAGRIGEAANVAVDAWREAGHAKAEIAGQQVTARHAAAELDVAITLAPGPRVRFGDTIVSGETRVRPTRVRAIAGLPAPGTLYMPAAVEKAAERLQKTGTFQSVQLVEGEVVGSDGEMDVEIIVVDRARRRIGGGVELSSLDGLTLTGYWQHRNLLGGAEQLWIEGEVAQIGGEGSGIDYRLRTRFEKPAVYGPDTLFFTELELSALEEPDYDSRGIAFEFGATRDLSETLTGELAFGVELVEIDDRFTAPPATIRREFEIYRARGKLTWDRRDDVLDTTSGSFVEVVAEPFYEGRADYVALRTGVDARVYRSVGSEGRTVLAGRLQFGSVVGAAAAELPPSYLYYSGGGGTVRGQPYQSLDADYAGGLSFGGRTFLGLSGEARFAVTDTIGVVAFADGGYIGSEELVDGTGDWHAGAGIGLRYKTPVGPIRADIAGPIAGETGNGVQLYIGIGQAF